MWLPATEPCVTLPACGLQLDKLLLAHGIGPARAERYGAGFMAVVNGDRVTEEAQGD